MKPEEQGILLLGLFVIVYAIAYWRGIRQGRRDNLIAIQLREVAHAQHNRGFGARLNIDACEWAVCRDLRKIAGGS